MALHLARDMERLHRHLLAMCALVEEMVERAVNELRQPNFESCQRLVQGDDHIDRWDVVIDDECLKVLALHQPVATDLRRITTVMKISWELERVADVAVNIAERAASLVNCSGLDVPEKLNRMTRIALDMLHDSIDAYVKTDPRLARQVCDRDDQLDRLNAELIAELIETMHRQPQLIDPALQMFSASRSIERVGDHATNIAEHVVFLVEGIIIRHHLNGDPPYSTGPDVD